MAEVAEGAKRTAGVSELRVRPSSPGVAAGFWAPPHHTDSSRRKLTCVEIVGVVEDPTTDLGELIRRTPRDLARELHCDFKMRPLD